MNEAGCYYVQYYVQFCFERVRQKKRIRNVPTLDRNSLHQSGFMCRPYSFCLGGEEERRGPTETTANLRLYVIFVHHGR